MQENATFGSSAASMFNARSLLHLIALSSTMSVWAKFELASLSRNSLKFEYKHTQTYLHIYEHWKLNKSLLKAQ